MSESTERKGPSVAGVFVVILSVIFCMLLVGMATSATVIIVFILVWAFIGCPLLMSISGKAFWDLKVDWVTGVMGATWWFGASLLLLPVPGYDYYPVLTWVSGLVLAAFTAIIVGKMARWWSISSMVTLGGFLGLAIIWMNNWAIHRHAVLAVDTSQWSWWYYVMITVVTSVAVVLITAVAQEIYYIAGGLAHQGKKKIFGK